MITIVITCTDKSTVAKGDTTGTSKICPQCGGKLVALPATTVIAKTVCEYYAPLSLTYVRK